MRFCVGGFGCEDCRDSAFGEGRVLEFAFEGGGVTAAAALSLLAFEEPERRPGWSPFCITCGDCDWNGPVCISDGSSEEAKGFSCPSLGRRDSVEPLFLMERVGGRADSSNRASSIWRRAIWPLSSSRRAFHCGIEVQSVVRASRIEKVEVAIVRSVLLGAAAELVGPVYRRLNHTAER